jgi:hypothetical protein
MRPGSAGHSRVPIERLVDLAALERADGRPPSPARIRAALPRGWALEENGAHAHRDARLFFREAWILIVGLIVFGSVGLAFLLGAMPSGARGWLRFGLLIAAVALLGGVVAPLVTRALQRRA